MKLLFLRDEHELFGFTDGEFAPLIGRSSVE
jgi:hypothetical protein